MVAIKINYDMKNRYIKLIIILCLAILYSQTNAVAQNQEKKKTVTIESIVKDQDGNPVKGAIVYGNEGVVTAITDMDGRFSIIIPDQSDLLIESDGYQSAIFRSGEYKNLKEFSLKSTPFMYGENDDAYIGFGKVKKGDLVNAVTILNPGEILRYDNIQDISEALSGRVPGLLGSSNIRGLGVPLYIVDGLPRDISTINLAEVEQITVLKDLNSAVLYGTAAVNGVVLITTKRGHPYKKQVNVTSFYGVSRPTALPDFLSSAEYATLYNEARVNDGLTPLYDEVSIANYTSGNKFRYPDINYYSREYLKTIKPFYRVMTELSGGNDIATYYSNMGWDQTGSLLDFGTGKTGNQNRFNIRGNVDLKINHWIRSSLDAAAVFNDTETMRGDYWAAASTLRPNLFSPLLPISLIDPDNELLVSRKNDINSLYLLGGNSSYPTNPIADGYSAGVNQNVQRTVSFNNRIDFDLSSLVKGLMFHTNLSFDFFTNYNQSVNNTYSVYEPIWDAVTDSIVDIVQYGTDTRTGTQVVSNSSYQRRFGGYGMLDFNRTFDDVHHVTASILANGSRYKVMNNIQANKYNNLGLRLGYVYSRKYMVDFSSAYASSAKLPVGNRSALSPTLGLAWAISSEDFMSLVSAIDYLKLRISAGIMNTDFGIDGFYYYDNLYGKSGSFNWYEGAWSNSGMVSSYGGNSKLFFEKRKEINAGFESMLFNKSLAVSANLFASLYSDMIVRPVTKYSSFYTDFIPYENYDANSYKGAELGVSYTQSIGEFSFTLGTNMLYYTSEVMKKDEIYVNDYQYRVGKPVDAIFGLVADGFFTDQTDIDNHELQVFSTVQPGDIKYVDQNDDGVIDTNDEIQIGRSAAPFSYGVNLKLSYRSFTLFAHGIGRMGADAFLNGNYYWVDGDDKYSAIVLNRWTESTKETATYPRLSSSASTNNFRNSTFWLYRDNYFTLNRVQLTYDMPETVARKLRMKKLSLFADGTRLLTISKHKDVRDLNEGGEPFYRSYSLGIRTAF